MSKKGLNEDDLVELLFSMNSAHQWNDREPAADFSAIPMPTEYVQFNQAADIATDHIADDAGIYKFYLIYCNYFP